MPGDDELRDAEKQKAEIEKLMPHVKCPLCHGAGIYVGGRLMGPIKMALDAIVELRAQPLCDLTREQMRVALKAFSAQLESDQADIPGDILEALGPEDRRAALLAFCNLVAVGTFGLPRQKPKPPPPLIIIPGRKL